MMSVFAGLLLMTALARAEKVELPPPGFLAPLRQQVQQALDRLDGVARTAADEVRAAGPTTAEARRTLTRLAGASPCVVDTAFVDAQGIMRMVAPAAYQRFEGADISRQKQIRRLHQTRGPVLSGSFVSVEGIEAVDLEYPVLDPRRRLTGSISLLLKPELLLREMAPSAGLPAGWEFWVLERDGRCLYGPRAWVGKNLFRDREPGLGVLGRQIARRPEGNGSYESRGSSEGGSARTAYWLTASLHGTDWRLLATCGRAKAARGLPSANILDLTYAYDENTIYWPTAEPFTLRRVARGTNDAGWWYASNNYGASEHGGTHADAPIHFGSGGRTMEQVPVTEWIAPAIKIDVTKACESNRDYQLTVQDILAWESQYGKIPEGAWVIMYTGIGTRFYPDKLKVLGTALTGKEALPKLSFPGFSPASATFLVTQRHITGIGLDTPSIDPGNDPDFKVHRILCAADKLALENLANLDRLPLKGTILHAIPMLIRDGTGSPVRAYAVWE